MILRKPVIGRRILLRDLRPGDVNARYRRWMNDREVNRYLESRLRRHSLKELGEFVRTMRNSPDNLLLAIVLKEGGHIGNIKLGPIDGFHRSGSIGLLIGEKDCWGQGYAAEAIRLISGYAFKTLKLHRLTAGIYANNTGSLKAFVRAGWFKEATERKSRRYGRGYIDAFKMARLNPSRR
jgi:ribosomal-protein-alanine N-acetyltransferase